MNAGRVTPLWPVAGFVRRLRAKRFAAIKARGDEFELRLLRPHLSGSPFIDVGASVGVYTAWALRCRSSSIVAVEPVPEQAERLRRIFGNTVTVVEAALSSTSGNGVLEIPVVDDIERSTRASLVQSSTRARRQTVRLLTFDELSVPADAVVKVDVEGAENQVVEGAAEALEQRGVRLWLIECEARHGQSSPSRLGRLMQRHGYVGWGICVNGLVPIDEFRPEIHQARELMNLVAAGGNRPPGYMNNFVFVREEEEDAFLARGAQNGFDRIP